MTVSMMWEITYVSNLTLSKTIRSIIFMRCNSVPKFDNNPTRNDVPKAVRICLSSWSFYQALKWTTFYISGQRIIFCPSTTVKGSILVPDDEDFTLSSPLEYQRPIIFPITNRAGGISCYVWRTWRTWKFRDYNVHISNITRRFFQADDAFVLQWVLFLLTTRLALNPCWDRLFAFLTLG